jgi:hypothetical protein
MIKSPTAVHGGHPYHPRAAGVDRMAWAARRGARWMVGVAQPPVIGDREHLQHVKSHGTWEVVDDDEVVLMPEKVIRCRFDLNHEVFPSGFYDVRWFRTDDRRKLVEITRERFQLLNHSIGPRRGVSRTNTKLAPKGLPAYEEESKPRRAVEIT